MAPEDHIDHGTASALAGARYDEHQMRTLDSERGKVVESPTPGLGDAPSGRQ